MKDIDFEALERILKPMKYDESKISEVIDLLKQQLGSAEASAPANVARQKPIKPGSSTDVHLEEIIKATEKYLIAVSALETDQELRARLRFSQQNNFTEKAEKLLRNAKDVKKYQSATGESKALHLLPELKGRNVQSYDDVMKVRILDYALSRCHIDIHPKENSHITDPFSRLASILLNKKDPRRTINSYLASLLKL